MKLRNGKGKFVKGAHNSIDTEFKKGEHWRNKKPYWNEDWLNKEYTIKNKSALQIANENGCKENNILYFLKKHNIKIRDMRTIRKNKHWSVCGSDNPMFNKVGEMNSNWKGGCSTERQLFYSSVEWKKTCSSVWIRDNATCRRCGIKADNGVPMHVHHIVSFSNKELRADANNLMLLCAICHNWTHSKKNTNLDYIEVDDGHENNNRRL